MNQRKPAKLTEAQIKKRNAAESKLIDELCSKHGYWLRDIKKETDRYVNMFNFKEGTNWTGRAMILMVPLDSSLGRVMEERSKTAAAKARRILTNTNKKRAARKLEREAGRNPKR